ncbi:MAG TPA: hypothetical protein VF483_13830, partial [Gemmatimonadaceae bacterium]
ALLGGLSIYQWRSSESDYAAYKRATSAKEAVTIYKSAIDEQKLSRNLAINAGLLWAVGAIEAGVSEWAHARHVKQMQTYGAR